MSMRKHVLLLLAVALATLMPSSGWVPEAVAEQTGGFSGKWTANGLHQPFDFVKGREVGTFKLAGNISLKPELSGIADFWAECVGLSDSAVGGSVRCVWRSLNGEKAYSVLRGQPLEKGVKVTGEFVGGTGRLDGLTGTFDFTWKYTFADQGQGNFTGYTQDLNGTFHIP